MRTSFASAISVLGVVAAGAAAFAVNTAVLSPSGEAIATASAPIAAPSTTIAPVADPSRTASKLATAAATQTSTYRVGDAGRVIVEVVDGQLRVANVLPSAGWTARAPEYDDGEVEVEFKNGSATVEFKARLEGAEIKVFVEAENDEDEAYEREYHDDDDDEDDDDHEDDHEDEDDD